MNDYSKNDFWTDPKETMTWEHGADGAGIIDSAFGLRNAAVKGNEVGLALGSVGLALDVLGLVIDPIGSVLSAAIGWLIDHVTPFRVPLDMLMGDPIGIDAAKAAIEAEKKKLEEEWAPAFDGALKDLKEAWKGDGAEAFEKDMDGLHEHLKSLAEYVDTASTQMGIAGGLVGAFRGIIRDIIAGVLGGIIAGAICAAAAMPFTFGTSIGIFLGTVAATVGITMVKIAEQISKLVQKLTTLLKSMTGLTKSGDEAAEAVAKAAGGGGKPHTGGAGGDAPKVDTGGKPEGNGGKTDGNTPQGDNQWLKLTPDERPPTQKPPEGGSGGKSDSDTPQGDNQWLKLTPDEHPPAKPPDGEGAGKTDGPGGKDDGKNDADGGGKDDGSGGKTDGAGDKKPWYDTGHKPWPDKITDIVRQRLDKEMFERLPNSRPEERDIIRAKFEEYLQFGKPDLVKKLGEPGAAKFESIAKTLTDPAYAARGFLGKSSIEFIKSLSTVSKEVTPDDSSDD
jgi:uncharacterized protein YukE